MSNPDSPETISRRLRRRVFLERFAGFLGLAALGCLAWGLRAYWVSVIVVPMMLASVDLSTLGTMLGQAFLLSYAVFAWCSLVAPVIRGSRSSDPSFDRIGAGLLGVARGITGWKARISRAGGPGPAAHGSWMVRAGLLTLSVGGFVVACVLAADPTAVPWLAAVVPTMGIAAFPLVAGGTEPGASSRAERLVIVLMGAVVSGFIVLSSRGWGLARSEQETSSGLRDAIRAQGIPGDSWDEAMKVLRLAIRAHRVAPTRVSGETLRRSIDALPVPAGFVSARRAESFGQEREVVLERIALSRSGALVAGAAIDGVSVWARGTERELCHFDCLGQGKQLRFSPDESFLVAVTDWGSVVRVFDPSAGRERMRVELRGVTEIQIAPDGQRVIALEGRRQLHVLSMTGSGVVGKVDTGAPVLDLTFSRDGHHLAYATSRGKDVALGFLDLTATPPKASPTAPADWMPAMDSFALVPAPGECVIHDWKTGQVRSRIAHEGCRRAFLDASGRRLITLGKARQPGETAARDELRSWSLPGGESIGRIGIVQGIAGDPIISEDGEVVAWRCGTEYRAYRWSIGDLKPSIPLENVSSLALDASGRQLAVSSTAIRHTPQIRAGRLWSFATDDVSTVLSRSEPSSSRMHLDGRAGRAAAIARDRVDVLELESGRRLFSIHRKDVTWVEFDPVGMYVATCAVKEGLELWTIDSERIENVALDVPVRASSCSLRFGPGGHWIAVSGGRGSVHLRDLPGLAPLLTLETNASAAGFSPSDDGRFLAVNDGKTVNVVDIMAKRSVLTLRVPQWQGSGNAHALFRPGTHELVVASTDTPEDPTAAVVETVLATNQERVELWDVDRGKKIRGFRPERAKETNRVAIDRKGEYIALTNALNGPVEIRRLADRALLAVIDERRIDSLAFCDDSRFLFSVSMDGKGQVWSIESGAEVDRLPAMNLREGLVRGRYAVTLSRANELQRWLIDPRGLIDAGVRRLAGSGSPY